ncbi:histidine ammonia-lyase [Alteribacter natronophilus]|uniref:histidine ammonia-lyase n=1 Tax=Alteribacter natronophilus TaxID=2583810 RepID=UPI00110D604D|nr:histidine ammonia-lyase [Alteribacter natronophilus]TMW70638.1 histidine ammonia-lyase [Alteribacter natronophilus]
MILSGNDLSLEKFHRAVTGGEKVEASEEALERVANSRRAVEKIVNNGQTVYGINTGFGKFSDVKIAKEDVVTLQKNLILSHACGTGEPFSEDVSRGMLLLRVNTMLKGFSGVRIEVVNQIIDFLNEGIHPVVPSQGSLGASGDLAPLAHLALALLGEGDVVMGGERIAAAQALEKAGLKPLTLEAKEGLALINGTQAMTSVGALACLEAERLFDQADTIASVTLEGLRGIVDAFDEDIHLARGHSEQTAVAQRVRDNLSGSRLVTRQGELRVQDAYSLRCIPQVHGASREALAYVKKQLETEMNAATDNPLLFDDGEKVLSGGNFHGQPVALAMDFLAICVAEMASISERRIERLVNPQLNDLPAFLSPRPGLESGAMILQYVAASLVSENKTLAHPASVDSIPSSANQEDHVSMGTTGARHAAMVTANARKVLAIEAICAMQAAEHRGVERMGEATRRFYDAGRTVVPSITGDRVFSKDIEAMDKWMKENEV